MTSRLLAPAFAVVLLLPLGTVAHGQVVTNGGFETNGGAGTMTYNGWTHAEETGCSSGAWYAQTGTLSPTYGATVAAPPEGSFAAMTDETETATMALYQDITVPATGGILSFELYLRNDYSSWITPSPQTLDACTGIANQQFRADIIKTTADPIAYNAADVLMTLYQTQPGDPLESGYTEISANVSPLAGQTVRLRFVVAERHGYLWAGVDAVSLTTGVTAIPTLSVWALMALALGLALAATPMLVRRS